MKKKKKDGIKDLIARVNKSIIWYKKGGWIDCRRTPTSGENLVESLEEFIEARFNRECWDLPEFNEACELLDGKLFICTLDGVDEVRKRFRKATLRLVKEEDILDPSPQLLEILKNVREFLGGSSISFNGVRIKIKYEIENV